MNNDVRYEAGSDPPKKQFKNSLPPDKAKKMLNWLYCLKNNHGGEFSHEEESFWKNVTYMVRHYDYPAVMKPVCKNWMLLNQYTHVVFELPDVLAKYEMYDSTPKKLKGFICEIIRDVWAEPDENGHDKYVMGAYLIAANQVTDSRKPNFHMHCLIGKVRFKQSDKPLIKAYEGLPANERKNVLPFFFRGKHKEIKPDILKELREAWYSKLKAKYQGRIPKGTVTPVWCSSCDDDRFEYGEAKDAKDRQCAMFYVRNQGLSVFKKYHVDFMGGKVHMMKNMHIKDVASVMNGQIQMNKNPMIVDSLEFFRRYMFMASSSPGKLRVSSRGYLCGNSSWNKVIADAKHLMVKDGSVESKCFLDLPTDKMTRLGGKVEVPQEWHGLDGRDWS